jgi:hypothetical protein
VGLSDFQRAGSEVFTAEKHVAEQGLIHKLESRVSLLECEVEVEQRKMNRKRIEHASRVDEMSSALLQCEHKLHETERKLRSAESDLASVSAQHAAELDLMKADVNRQVQELHRQLERSESIASGSEADWARERALGAYVQQLEQQIQQMIATGTRQQELHQEERAEWLQASTDQQTRCDALLACISQITHAIENTPDSEDLLSTAQRLSEGSVFEKLVASVCKLQQSEAETRQLATRQRLSMECLQSEFCALQEVLDRQQRELQAERARCQLMEQQVLNVVQAADQQRSEQDLLVTLTNMKEDVSSLRDQHRSALRRLCIHEQVSKPELPSDRFDFRTGKLAADRRRTADGNVAVATIAGGREKIKTRSQ